MALLCKMLVIIPVVLGGELLQKFRTTIAVYSKSICCPKYRYREWLCLQKWFQLLNCNYAYTTETASANRLCAARSLHPCCSSWTGDVIRFSSIQHSMRTTNVTTAAITSPTIGITFIVPTSLGSDERCPSIADRLKVVFVMLTISYDRALRRCSISVHRLTELHVRVRPRPTLYIPWYITLHYITE